MSQQKSSGRVGEVFGAFLKLGITSFGGPIAHVGYFRHEFIERRAWLNESQFAHVLALCQFLPGPTSSQLGFSIGLLHAGWFGALSAFIGFTLPSAALLFGLAALLSSITGTFGSAAIHGLKIVALSIVAQAVLVMWKQHCPDAARMAISADDDSYPSACGSMGNQSLTRLQLRFRITAGIEV